MIRIYQRTLSRVLPPSCRFTPSCSEYGAQAISRYGVWRGGRGNPFALNSSGTPGAIQ